jgi:hypothetical protein
MDLPFAYPKSAPAWLPAWPAETELQALFHPGIRDLAWRLLARGHPTRLEWTDTGLSAAIAGQSPNWRMAGDAWRRSCSCGYRNDRCIHLFLLARLFVQAARQEGWLKPGAGPPAPTPPPAAARNRLVGVAKAPATTGAAAPAAPSGGTAGRRLEAEADFHLEPGWVALRFYLHEHGMRRLLRMQSLRNFCLQAHDAAAGWRPEDVRLLEWLRPHLAQPVLQRENLQVLKVPAAEFERWLEFWEEAPGRFLDRASQAPLRRDGPAAALHFELCREGDRAALAAVVTAPDGRRWPLAAVLGQLAEGRRQFVLDQQLLEFAPPVPWDHLREFFAERAVRLLPEAVPAHLPALVQERLDLVRGPAVRHFRVPAAATVGARADGADILLSVRVGEAPLFPGSRTAAAAIRAAGDGWEITTYASEHQDALVRFLKSLPVQRAGARELRLAGTTANMAALAVAWERLPPEVGREADPSLDALLGGAADLVAEIQLRDHGRFVDADLRWSSAGGWLSDGDLRSALARGDGVLRTREGGWLRLDLESAGRMLSDLEGRGFAAGGRRLFRHEAARLLDLLPRERARLAGGATHDLAQRLVQEAAALGRPALPAELKPVLRDYQARGFEFLAERAAYGVGAILADDMGLGKTLQVLALLQAWADERRAGRRPPRDTSHGALVVCPASVVAVWLGEAARFCPSLRCVAYAGTREQRAALLNRPEEWDVLVAHYALLRQDAEAFLAAEFDSVALDEAQQIKNPDSQVARVACALRTPRPLALTGTPLENRLLDLWSILQFLNPGFLGARDAFLARWEVTGAQAKLAPLLAPVLLRRLKEEVAAELPPRTEEVLRVELGEAQRALYQAELAAARDVLRTRGPVETLAALTRLRQVCCHPRLLLKEPTPVPSAKLDELLDLLAELREEGHSVLVFSQFVQMLELIGDALRAAGTEPFLLTGDTPMPERARLVRAFSQAAEPGVFLLSLKAAGTGLTLTRADYVVIFDPWWNPAVERQAIDRTHRIGQTRPVIAYRLVAADTIEEKILALQREKAELFDAVVGGAARAGAPARLTAEDLARLLA